MMPVVSMSTSQASKSALPLVMRSMRCVSWISMGLAKAELAESSAIPVNKPMREFMLATSEIPRNTALERAGSRLIGNEVVEFGRVAATSRHGIAEELRAFGQIG